MKFLLIATLLVAAGHAGPVTHTLEVGSDGAVGSSLISPLVSIIINVSKALGDLVSIEGLPDNTAPAVVPPTPVPAPPAVNPVPVLPVLPVLPPPSPAVPEVPDVVSPVFPEPSPVVPGVPIVVAPVFPEPSPVVPGVPIVVAPVFPEPSPAVPEVPGVNPLPVIPIFPVAPETPVDPETGLSPVESDGESSVTNNFLINVILNFILGSDGSTSVSAGSLPSIANLPRPLQQLLNNFASSPERS